MSAHTDPATNPSPATVYSRGNKQPRESATKHDGPSMLAALDAALLDTECRVDSKPLIEWDDIGQLAAADVDFHGEIKFTGNLWNLVNLGPTPRPKRAWRTHGGGLRGIFDHSNGWLNAEEQAALWLYGLHTSAQIYGYSGLEIKAITYHPWFKRDEQTCSDVLKVEHGADGDDMLQALLRNNGQCDVPEHKRDEWLAENDMQIGSKYPHNRCPEQPEHESKNDPVFVTEHGLFCHSCSGRGVRCFTPFSALIGCSTNPRTKNLLWTMARCWTHWEQAQHVLKHLNVPDALAKLIYRAALKQVNLREDDAAQVLSYKIPKISYVMCEHDLVLTTGGWTDAKMTKSVVKGLEHRIDSLPATSTFELNPRGKYSQRRKRKAYGRLLGAGDCTSIGYPPLHVIKGVDMILRTALNADDTIRAVSPADPPFTRKQTTAEEIAWAEAHFKEQFPGINMTYFYLLLYGKAFIQRNLTEPPMIYVYGPSGGGKTTTAQAAGEVGLSEALILKWTGNVERFEEKYAEAALATDFLILDEFAKKPENVKELMPELLAMRRGRAFHKCYFGQMYVDRVPVVILTDVLLPKALVDDKQTARRIIGVDLGCGCAGKDWKKTCNTGTVVGWRKGNVLSADNAKSADILLNKAIEDAASFVTFEDAAASLGFHTLDHKEPEDDAGSPFRALFDAVCAVHETPKEERQKLWAGGWAGPGWVAMHVDDHRDHPVVKALLACVGNNLGDAQALHATQWGELLGKPNIVMDYKSHGRKFGIRFYIGKKPKDQSSLFNGTLGVEPLTLTGDAEQ